MRKTTAIRFCIAIICMVILSVTNSSHIQTAKAVTIVPDTSPAAVIALAREEVGYKEKKSNNNLYDKTANSGSNNYTKYAYEIDKQYPDYYWGNKNGATGWCGVFVDWLFIKAYGYKKACELTCTGGNNMGAANPGYAYGYYKSKGQTGNTPKIGAQIFYNENGNTCSHTGIVVDMDNNYVYTIDGNWGDKVCSRKVSKTSSEIYGYGYPGYEDSSTVLLPVEGIDLNIRERSLNLAETVSLSVNVTPAGASKAVNWTTSNSAIATVSTDGVVTPHQIGETIITATSKTNPNAVSQCKITTYYEQKDGNLRFNGIKYPHTYAIGKTFTWQGTVESDVDLETITVTLYTASNKYTKNISIPAGTRKYTMKTAGDDVFRNLGTGQFTFQITATDVMKRKIGFSNGTCTAKTGIGSHTLYDCNTSYMRPALIASKERNGHRYELYKFTSKIWDVAKAYAEEKNGHLATIADAGENDFVCNFVVENDPKKEMDFVYTGGYYTSAGWKWVDGTPFIYHPWRSDAAADGAIQYIPVSSLCRASQKVWGKASNTEMSYFLVEYDPQPVTSIVVSGDETVTVDETIPVNASVFPFNAYNREVQWSSSDNSIATVSASGIVTGKKEGDVVIKATALDGSGVSGQYTLHVQHQPIRVEGILLNADSYLYSDLHTLVTRPGNSFVLRCFINPWNADNQSVSYISSDSTIAAVDEYSGTVTALAEGSCELSVISYDGGYRSKLKLLVINPDDMSHGEFLEAEAGTIVSVVTYIQDKLEWVNGMVNLYCQSEDGGYFIRNMACPAENIAGLTAGTKIRVLGTKAVVNERAEIQNAQYEVVGEDQFIAEPVDVTNLLYKNEIEIYMNSKVSFKGLKTFPSYYADLDEERNFLYGEDGHGSHIANSDIYFNVEREGYVYTFIVESSLRDKDTAVYQTAESLQIEDALEGEGYLYWDYGPVLQVTRLQVLPPRGYCGENVTWEYEEGTLTIRGSGDMEDYDYSNWTGRPWECYKYDITNVEIENGVTSIGQCAFAWLPLMKTVSIAESVTRIGPKAFFFTPGLKQITLPNSLISIGKMAFAQGGLTQATIPQNVAEIGEDVWLETPIDSIEVNGSNSWFRSEDGILFSKDMNRLICAPTGKSGDYLVPLGTGEIADYAFHGCENIQGITIPATVTKIGSYAFAGCERLKSIFISDSVDEIGDSITDGDPFAEILCLAESPVVTYAMQKGIPYQIIIPAEAICNGLTELREGETGWTSFTLIPENSSVPAKYIEEIDGDVCRVTGDGKITAWKNGFADVTIRSAENPEISGFAHIWVHDNIHFEYEVVLEQEGIIQLTFLCDAEHKDSISGYRLSWLDDPIHDYELVSVSLADTGDFGLQAETFDGGIICNADNYGIPADTGIVFRLQPKDMDGLWGTTEEYKFDFRLCYKGIPCTRAGKQLALQLTFPEQHLINIPDFTISDVTIPAGIVEIQAEAFAGTAVKSVMIKDLSAGQTLTIRSGAFEGCSNLEWIRIPEGTIVESGAFDGCNDVCFYGKKGTAAETLAMEYAIYACFYIEEK